MEYQTDIEALLRKLQPQSLLCLGEACTALLQPYLRGTPTCRAVMLPTQEWQRIAELGRFDLALLGNGLDSLDKDSATHLLARLRDLHGGRFALFQPMTPQPRGRWQHTELLAFGLRLLRHYTIGADSYHLYYFDLYDYKSTPDWLNPRFWANPERWDKDHW